MFNEITVSGMGGELQINIVLPGMSHGITVPVTTIGSFGEIPSIPLSNSSTDYTYFKLGKVRLMNRSLKCFVFVNAAIWQAVLCILDICLYKYILDLYCENDKIVLHNVII